MLIDQKLSLGKIIGRVILKIYGPDMASSLRNEGFGVTELTGREKSGPVRIVFSTIQRKLLPRALTIIHQIDQNAFYSVEEVSTTAEGYFIKPVRRSLIPIISPFSFSRKGR
jgi:uncharacterized protein YebE (UPF0316 family)